VTRIGYEVLHYATYSRSTSNDIGVSIVQETSLPGFNFLSKFRANGGRFPAMSY